MSNARKIISSTLVQLLGKVITAVLSLVVVKMLTGYLTQQEYGYYGTVYNYLAMFGILADLGLYTVAIAEMSKKKDDQDMIIGNILSIRTVLGISTTVLAVCIGFFIPTYQGTPIPLSIIIAGVAVVLALMNGTLLSVLQVHYKMIYSVYSVVWGKLINVLVMIFIVFLMFPKQGGMPTDPMAFYGLIFSGIIGNLVLIGITIFYTRRYADFRLRWDWHYWGYIIKKTLPYGIALILSTLYFKIDIFIISIMQDAEHVAIYDVVVKILEVLNVASLFFLNSLLPLLSQKIEEKSESLQPLIQHSVNFLYAMGAPVVVGGLLTAYQIVYLIADPAYLSGYVGPDGVMLVHGSDFVLKLLVFSLCISFVDSLFGYLLVASGHQSKLLWVNGFCLVFNVVLNLIFIPMYSYVGAAVITILTELLVLILGMIVSYRYVKFRIEIWPLIKITFASLAMGIVIYFARDPLITVLQNKALLVIIPLAALVYGVLLFATGVLNKDVLALLKKSKQ